MTTLPLTEAAVTGTHAEWADVEQRLQRRFSHIDARIVRAALQVVQQEFAGARVRAYLHILVEREAIDRLARGQGRDEDRTLIR